MSTPAREPQTPDPRRWITLGVLVGTVVLVAMDLTVLNVSIPAILRDLDTTVPSLGWVIAGYSLTFASLLIVGGRLGDLFGHRRIFVIGALVFGTGSLLAALSPGIGFLILGKAVIEGVGAALMVPATLALLAATFQGHERSTAFAAWGAAAGAAVAFGPVVGGFLTTNYSWRWCFAVNVVLAPLAALLAMVLMRRSETTARVPIDGLGAALVAGAMFCIVFALSQGPTYGWLRASDDLTLAGVDLWPASMPVSIVAVAFVAGFALLAAFVSVERRKERRGADPLFELGQLRYRTFRYGLITAVVIAVGQLGMLFALPIFLQGSNGLTAEESGVWMIPIGLAIVLGAQVGGRLHTRYGTTRVVQVGFFLEAAGLAATVPALEPGVGFWPLLPGVVLFGVGVGSASSQLTNVVLSEVPMVKSGVASGANSTARQLGAALGATLISSIITIVTTNQAIDAVRGAGLRSSVTDRTVADLDALGANWQAPSGITPGESTTLDRAFDDSLAAGTRWAFLFAAGVVLVGALFSLLIPQVRQVGGESVVGERRRVGADPDAQERGWSDRVAPVGDAPLPGDVA